MKTKIIEYKIRLTKWCLVKLIDLCKGDYNVLAIWLNDLKWEKIKDNFKLFKQAAENEKVDYERLMKYKYIKIPFYIKTIGTNKYIIIENYKNEEKVVAEFNDITTATEYLNYRLDKNIV